MVYDPFTPERSTVGNQSSYQRIKCKNEDHIDIQDKSSKGKDILFLGKNSIDFTKIFPEIKVKQNRLPPSANIKCEGI